MNGNGDIGFIGLGTMGWPMAMAIQRSDIQVVGYDQAEGRRDEALNLGMKWVSSCAEIVDRVASGNVVVMVRTSADLDEVLSGPNGLSAAACEGLLVILMSTLSPSVVERASAFLVDRGALLLDAPVSGAVKRAISGNLTVMYSGESLAEQRAMSALRALGDPLIRVGETPGMAQAAKLANQLMLVTNMIGVDEGIAFAEAYGVPEDVLIPIVQTSSGASWVTQDWGRIKDFWFNYVPGNSLDILRKDIAAALESAQTADLELPVARLGASQLRVARTSGTEILPEVKHGLEA